MNQPYASHGTAGAPTGQAMPPAGQPADASFVGFSVAAIGVLIGAVLSLVAYPMTWFYVTSDPDAKVDGLTRITNSANYEVQYSSSKVHWFVLGAALVLGGLAIARLLGKYTDGLVRPSIIVGVIAVGSGLFSAFAVPDGFSTGVGAYLALVGAVIMLVSVLAMTVAKK